jgi:hypothetical protein
MDDLVYSVVASAHIGEPSDIERTINALLITFPDFDPSLFVDGLPYQRAQDRDLVLGTLELAISGDTN